MKDHKPTARDKDEENAPSADLDHPETDAERIRKSSSEVTQPEEAIVDINQRRGQPRSNS